MMSRGLGAYEPVKCMREKVGFQTHRVINLSDFMVTDICPVPVLAKLEQMLRDP